MITATIDNRLLQFNFDGTVFSPTDNKKGQWTTEAAATDDVNSLSFTLPDQTHSRIAIDYDFNESNQLTIAIPKQAGIVAAVAAIAVPGQLFADDPNDLQYAVLNDDGSPSAFRLFVYGQLRLEQRLDQLILKLSGSDRDILITGDKSTALTTDAFQQPGQDTIDRLRFSAKTRNKLEATTKILPADIHFTGAWTFSDGQLVFSADFSNNTGHSDAIVSLVGTYKATNFGLVFSSTAAGKEFTFKIDSKFQVSGITGEWELQLGYSPQSKFASGSFKAKSNIPVGKNGQVAIQGTVSFSGAPGGLALDVDLQATYAFANGQLVFSVKAGPAGYNLFFGGQFKIGNNGTVTFALKSGPGGVSGSIAVQLGGLDDSKLKGSLELILSRSGSTLTVDLGVSFKVMWVNGTMIAA
jgi:hypothetical protein